MPIDNENFERLRAAEHRIKTLTDEVAYLRKEREQFIGEAAREILSPFRIESKVSETQLGKIIEVELVPLCARCLVPTGSVLHGKYPSTIVSSIRDAIAGKLANSLVELFDIKV
jgi:hypothetical protein